jgi:hypothetical protein
VAFEYWLKPTATPKYCLPAATARSFNGMRVEVGVDVGVEQVRVADVVEETVERVTLDEEVTVVRVTLEVEVEVDLVEVLVVDVLVLEVLVLLVLVLVVLVLVVLVLEVLVEEALVALVGFVDVELFLVVVLDFVVLVEVGAARH